MLDFFTINKIAKLTSNFNSLKTASTLHFLLVELATHPEIQDEIYLELSKISDTLTEEDLLKIPLIKASLKESQR